MATRQSNIGEVNFTQIIKQELHWPKKLSGSRKIIKLKLETKG